MKLINADDVKELLKGLDSLPWDEEVDEMVDRMSTAYDIEAVVKELEELAEDVMYPTDEDYFCGQYDGFVQAIEIVKGGVKNE